MLSFIWNTCNKMFNRVQEIVKQWTKPTTVVLIADAVTDMTRSRQDLMAENAILRQQLIVLNRSVKRPQFTEGDRVRLTLLARLTGFWQSALHIVQPETVLRWHRDLFRRYWKLKSESKGRKPRIPQETIDLIKQMAIENPRWGAKMICGELLKLGISVHKRTVQRHMRKVRKRNSGQNWATFLRNHAQDIWACDFTVVHDLLFRPLYIFIIIELKRRRIVHAAVTRNPTNAWVAQHCGKRPHGERDPDTRFEIGIRSSEKDLGGW